MTILDKAAATVQRFFSGPDRKVTTYPHLMGQLFNRPLLVTPERGAELAAYMASRVGLAGDLMTNGAVASLTSIQAASVVKYAPGDNPEAPPIELYRVRDGIANICIHGTLVQRNGLESWSGMIGYDGVRARFRAALADSDVRGVMLDVDSPGGDVAGCFDLADEIRESPKPVWSHVNELAASAAYALASQSDFLVAAQTGRVGSIGAIVMHTDRSRETEEAGLKVTLITAGKHKADGNPYEALPEEVRDRVASELETIRKMFAEKVAMARPGLSVDAVLATEAAVFFARDAVALGLVDTILPLDAAIAAFAASLAEAPPGQSAETETKGTDMSASTLKRSPQAILADLRAKGLVDDEEENPEAEAPGEDKQGDEEAPEPEAEEGEEKPKDAAAETDEGKPRDAETDEEPEAKAAKAERNRIAAILSSKEARGRASLANHLALKTRTPVKAALAILAAASPSGLGSKMAGEPNAVISPSASAAESDAVATLKVGAFAAFGPKSEKK